jgi:hypothetical protein
MMSAATEAGGRPRDPRAGVILPAALFVLLGGTLVAASLLVTARVAVQLSEGDRRLAEAFALRPPGVERVGAALGGGGSLGGGDPLDWGGASGSLRLHHPGEGFLLVGEAGGWAGWGAWAVNWVPDLNRVAGTLEAAAMTGEGFTVDGGELRHAGGAEGCDEGDYALPLGLHERHRGPRPPLPDPMLPNPPRLGPIALERVAARAGTVLDSGGALPDGGGVDVPRRLIAVSPPGRIEGGVGAGILVADGDLAIEGGALFRGLVLAGGDLTLRGGAGVIGAVQAGGELVIEDGAWVAGCRGVVAGAGESISELALPFLMRGGEFLGRF